MSPSGVPPPPMGPTRDRPPAEARSGPPSWLLPAALTVALLMVAVTGTLAYTQRQEIERLRADLAEAEARIAELEARLAEVEGGGGLGRLLEELFGEQGGLDGLLEGGLDGLLDGMGGLGDLFGRAGGVDVAECLGAGGLGGLLGGSAPIVADDLATQIDAIADRVESLRGLQFREPVEPELVTSEEFTALVTELVSEDYTAEDADLDRRVLASLGAVEPHVDLRSLQLDLLGEQAAGFYHPETGRLVVRADSPDALLSPTEQVILAHELDHAVADQNLGLPEDVREAPGEGDAPRAALALVEGDATLLMQQFTLDALSMIDQLAMVMDPSMAASQEQIGGYPEYLQRELVFPYAEGMVFACALYADGGWPAVDAAYADLPTTTAQVLWPERYAAGEGAADVSDLGSPGGDWSEVRSTTFGAADLLWLFSAPGDDTGAALEEPERRAAAWAGGQLTLWADGTDSALGVTLVEREGERDLCSSVSGWYAAAFPGSRSAGTVGNEALAVSGPAQGAVVVCAGNAVRVGIAPDLATARRVAG